MSTASTKPSRGGPGVDELAGLRDVLVGEKQRLERLLGRVERALLSAGVREDAGSANKAAARGGDFYYCYNYATGHTGRASRAGVRDAAPRPSPLDRVKGVRGTTADLRVANGNLSADRIAKLYGISLSQLAVWLGRTKQAVSKTPDADSLQNALSYFERVARLRLMLKGDAEFRKWLRTPCGSLENASPLEALAKGQWQPMADYVDDILTGMPG
jgi:hypothetical protein